MTRPLTTPQRRITTHVETLHGELCIYEWTTKTVHALNPAAARVWEMCDGRTTIEEMTARIRRDCDLPRAAVIVEHALTQFKRAGLLEPGSLVHVAPLVSRRALLRRIGAAAAIPVVTSIVAPAPLAAQSGNTRMFFGGTASFTVPAGVISLTVDVRGASGGVVTFPPFFVSHFVGGGRVEATLPVTPLEVLTIIVGGLPNPSGGFNGGGDPGANGGAGGGGASEIRRGGVRLVVAGGGGGWGPGATEADGGPAGAGGGLIGGTATGTCGGGGGGGTQVAGGAGGTGGSGGASGSPGVSGTGGKGADGVGAGVGGSGGGGGYFGGGGGGACGVAGGGGGGGGGSSYTDPSATGVVHTQGAGNGMIILSW
jgi:Coenzyme PQQ synthesis protein D (PqqD)/Glycine rich protein